MADTEAAPGVRAATPVPRTWRHVLSLRPEIVALVTLVTSVAVIGAIAHRTLYFQISEVPSRPPSPSPLPCLSRSLPRSLAGLSFSHTRRHTRARALSLII